MDGQEASSDRVARYASMVAIVLGCLSLAAIFFNPLVGAMNALIFFSAARGIRRRQAWAAIAVTCILLVPAVRAIFEGAGESMGGVYTVVTLGLSALIGIAFAWLPARAAYLLWKDPRHSRVAWPWIALLALLVAVWVFFKPYVTPTSSMENTLFIGDAILAETATWRLGRAPHRDQLIVFRYPVDPKQTYIKRVAGIPGDRLKIVNKQLYRNGSPVAEPYAIHTTTYVDAYRDNFPSAPSVNLASQGTEMLQNNVRDGEVVVPAGKYFVLGDSRDNSLDSRYWGFVSRSDIIGSPFLVYASFDTGTGPAGTASMSSILNTRWNRLLKLL